MVFSNLVLIIRFAERGSHESPNGRHILEIKTYSYEQTAGTCSNIDETQKHYAI